MTWNGVKRFPLFLIKVLSNHVRAWIELLLCLTGDKPNLRQLQRLCKGCMKVTILKNIAPKWKELAMEMGFEYSDIEIVDMQTKTDPKNAVYEILGRWLEGTVATDTRPLTWSTLVECLSNIECQSLADELSQILLD